MSQKRENFVRLAQARVNRALREIRLIGNLSNKGAYEYADGDVRKMFAALQKGLDAARSRFADADVGAATDFRL